MAGVTGRSRFAVLWIHSDAAIGAFFFGEDPVYGQDRTPMVIRSCQMFPPCNRASPTAPSAQAP
jgi:hypothetical protein